MKQRIEVFVGLHLVNAVLIEETCSSHIVLGVEDIFKQFKEKHEKDRNLIKTYSGLVRSYIVDMKKMSLHGELAVSIISLLLYEPNIGNVITIKQKDKVLSTIDVSWLTSLVSYS